jgi:hypothetical protein
MCQHAANKVRLGAAKCKHPAPQPALLGSLAALQLIDGLLYTLLSTQTRWVLSKDAPLHTSLSFQAGAYPHMLADRRAGCKSCCDLQALTQP